MKKCPTRKKILANLNDLVSSSKLHPVFSVEVYSQTNHLESYSAFRGVFKGGSAKDDLLAFLMDKSLTHRLLDMRSWYIGIIDNQHVMEVHIYLLGSDEQFLEYTNLDSEMLDLFGKVRFVGENI